MTPTKIQPHPHGSASAALQVVEHFPHYYNMTKSGELKPIDLAKAYVELATYDSVGNDVSRT
ncbi:MAG: hypothetical protein IJV22_10135 [Bacteroidales bacterium]|nr:hypothetical protein [Bacteroidales bacterium]MBQ9639896.1 hypothetical protein [Bacteroidales bacterium]